MTQLKEISPVGVLVGFVVVVATSIVLSIFSPIFFSQLVRSGDMNSLVTSPGPLSYALVVIFISTAFGVLACSMVAQRTKLVNVVLVVALYGAFSYWLSLSPSNQAKPYPDWYILMSYIVLIPGAMVGHYASRTFVKNA